MDELRKIPIGGIKFSEELVHLRLTGNAADNVSIDRLLQRIAAASINLPFLCHRSFGPLAVTSCCASQEDYGRLQQVFNAAGLPTDMVAVTRQVGTITVFPHGNSLLLLGLITALFAARNFPIHSLGSSISAIAVNTAYPLLDTIAGGLQEKLQLPANHAPFRQTVRLEQLTG